MEKLRKGKLYLLLAVSCQPLKSFVSRIAISVGLLFVCVYVHMRTCMCVYMCVCASSCWGFYFDPFSAL